jgi:hypothetical protein
VFQTVVIQSKFKTIGAQVVLHIISETLPRSQSFSNLFASEISLLISLLLLSIFVCQAQVVSELYAFVIAAGVHHASQDFSASSFLESHAAEVSFI